MLCSGVTLEENTNKHRVQSYRCAPNYMSHRKHKLAWDLPLSLHHRGDGGDGGGVSGGGGDGVGVSDGGGDGGGGGVSGSGGGGPMAFGNLLEFYFISCKTYRVIVGTHA